MTNLSQFNKIPLANLLKDENKDLSRLEDIVKREQYSSFNEILLAHNVTLDKISQREKEFNQRLAQIEADLEEVYGKSVLYKYNLGKFLGELLTKYNISASERKQFWDEIKTFATKENRRRDESKNAETRSFYGQCYRLSQFDQEVVEKLSWRQWQDILDRVLNREDERIFEWIRNNSECHDLKKLAGSHINLLDAEPLFLPFHNDVLTVCIYSHQTGEMGEVVLDQYLRS